MLKEVKDAEGQILLFIDEIHTIVGAGKTEGSMDAGNLLKPMLARGELHCIGATTLDEYRQNFEKDKALERRFQRVMVNEPNVEYFSVSSVFLNNKEVQNLKVIQKLDSKMVFNSVNWNKVVNE